MARADGIGPGFGLGALHLLSYVFQFFSVTPNSHSIGDEERQIFMGLSDIVFEPDWKLMCHQFLNKGVLEKRLNVTVCLVPFYVIVPKVES